MTRVLLALGAAAFASAALSQHPGAAPAPAPVSFTAAQAVAGGATYGHVCAGCHGTALNGAGGAPALVGPAFGKKYGGKGADQLFAMVSSMPPGGAGSLTPAQYAELTAYILRYNGLPAGTEALSSDAAVLAKRIIPGGAPAAARGGSLPPVAGNARLAALTPVPEAALARPAAADWPSWRRTRDAAGYSPLDQITPGNVNRLRVAWSWSLPAGGNMMAPIVHDGVLYALSFGDVVEALDAATGELLWRYQRPLAVVPQGKKGVALVGDLVILPTSDLHVVALDAKTGAVRWDHALANVDPKQQIKSAPLVAGDKVVLGINGFQEVKGGNFIVALDLATGAERWRFRTVARTGEPGGDSWNGEPDATRSGGSAWVGGSYDSATRTIYYGVGQTYDVVPLRLKPGSTLDNRALYTDSTVALDADTGKLRWFYQHQPDDQLDHDWAFERLLIPVGAGADRREAVVAAGKDAIFDLMDAHDGHYLFSLDMGLQNTVVAIDPKTGAKTINPAALPVGTTIANRFTPDGICPDLLGARNLMAGAYDPRARLLYMPLTDTCVHPFPDGQRWQLHPDAATAGTYGVLKAVDFTGRRVVWTARTKGAFVSGALATGGGLVFAGTADRRFKAFDAKTGRALWDTGVDNAPASYPVSYAVDGRQFVAVATNEGFVHTQAMEQVGHVRPPPAAGATLWVFALPEKAPRSPRP